MRARLDVKLWLYASVATFLLLSLASFAARLIIPAAPPSGAGMPPPGTDMMARVLIYLGRLVFSLVFVYVYVKGYEQKPWLGEGFRFGLCIAVLVAVPNLVYTIVAPAAPAAETIGPLTRNVIQLLLAGPLTAAIYRPRSAQAAK
ncbi:MAG TPA: hypothetical protein VMF59_02745 [Bacteroidota bacterium]|nr:hypothetical protein [Bacteroidota bacterium]